MQTHRLDATRCHVLFDASLTPVLTIDSGDIVTFQTLDACWSEVRSVEDFARYRKENRRGSNPLTGPVFVRGAKPGDRLQVQVLKIELDATGFQLLGPNRGVIHEELSDWTCHLVHVHDSELTLSNGLKLPIDPVIGELGNAPADAPTSNANPCGGNLDCPFIRVGAIVELPIEVEGALFSVGDVHARQGDGEIVGAPEIGAAVTLRLAHVPCQRSTWPLIEDAENWIAIATASTEAEAIRIAVLNAAQVICQDIRISFEDAMLLLTMSAKIHCCRTGLWGDNTPVTAVAVPKKVIRAGLQRLINRGE